ncbi:hypothetical protein JCM3765_001357 [Sporobolomyces pararoseus]
MTSQVQGDRYASPRIVLGEQVFNKLSNAKVLVVGAGGIGCELLKNMVMTGFGSGTSGGHIELLDLDTIDLSNLNRQFLFQKQHVKRPKSIVARETALKFNPNVSIKALHRNIKDSDFNVEYFKSFDLVLNALDNLDARRHVNKMCLSAGIPLIESGTSGYRGQVQPIFGGGQGDEEGTDCFDCTGKPVPKTFAVCTIRSTPSTAHHCIAWSKSYLFPQLFGADDESDQQELDDAEKNGENVDEIQELRKEALAIKELRSTLIQPDGGAAKRIFEKVYEKDIERLLQMTDMWNHRKPPHTLSFNQLEEKLNSTTNQQEQEQEPEKNGGGGGGIKDQRKLSLIDSFKLFKDSVERLTKRIDPTGGKTSISFDKDDDDTLDFVVASANLRASAFDIESQTRFQVKEYAGNIIPAIATTNAIIAGSIVLQSLAFFKSSNSESSQSSRRGEFKGLARSVWLNRQSDKVFDVGPCSSPNPFCAVCRIVYVPFRFKESTLTLGQFVKAITQDELKLGGEEKRISIMEGSRLLFETEDFEDNETEFLVENLNCGIGKFLTVENDDNDWPISFAIGSYLPEDGEKLYEFDLSEFPSSIPKKPLPPPIEDESKKNSDGADDDDISFAVDGEQDDDLMIIEPTSTDDNKVEIGKVQDLFKEAVGGQTVTEEQGTISGKKRSAGEAELGEGEGGEESPAKKELKITDKDQEKKEEKEVEVVDLT